MLLLNTRTSFQLTIFAMCICLLKNLITIAFCNIVFTCNPIFSSICSKCQNESQYFYNTFRIISERQMKKLKAQKLVLMTSIFSLYKTFYINFIDHQFFIWKCSTIGNQCINTGKQTNKTKYRNYIVYNKFKLILHNWMAGPPLLLL